MEPMVHIHFQALRENITDSNVRQHSVFSYVPPQYQEVGSCITTCSVGKVGKGLPLLVDAAQFPVTSGHIPSSFSEQKQAKLLLLS